MAILVTGANGFIGSAVVGRLAAAGHEVAAVVRSHDSAARRLPAIRCIALDMRSAVRPEDWLPHLAGVEAVVNCAGVLQDSPRDSTEAAHHAGPAALIKACEQAGVRRFVQMSALGVGLEGATRFLATKAAGDRALFESGLDWVILRPSVVLGRSAYGGGALFRALASLPVLPRQPRAGLLQVVQLDDVVSTVAHFLKPDAPARLTLELGGPEALSFEAVVAAYRRWLGWREARLISTPGWLSLAAFRIGDALSLLGWRPPIRITALREMARGSVGDSGPWIAATGIRPLSLGQALTAEPAAVQERWFASLYLLKPLALFAFALFWIVTGILSVGPGRESGARMLVEGGMGAAAEPAVALGGLIDLAIGVGMVFRRSCRLALWGAVVVSLTYALAGTLVLPRLWAEPLAPLLKIAPLLALNLILLAIREER